MSTTEIHEHHQGGPLLCLACNEGLAGWWRNERKVEC